MRTRLLALASLSLFGAFGAGSAFAGDLVWEVENPFRLFKTPQAFAQGRLADAETEDGQ